MPILSPPRARTARAHVRRGVVTAVAGVIFTICACLAADMGAAAASSRAGVGRAAAAVTTSVPAPSPTGCAAVLYNSLWYCRASVSAVKTTAYGTGKRVVLTGVSVTARTTSTVTVAGLEWPACAPGKFCGAAATVVTLNVPWSGSARPYIQTVVDLYGVTTAGTLTPVGYILSTDCYIDWC